MNQENDLSEREFIYLPNSEKMVKLSEIKGVSPQSKKIRDVQYYDIKMRDGSTIPIRWQDYWILIRTLSVNPQH